MGIGSSPVPRTKSGLLVLGDPYPPQKASHNDKHVASLLVSHNKEWGAYPHQKRPPR